MAVRRVTERDRVVVLATRRTQPGSSRIGPVVRRSARRDRAASPGPGLDAPAPARCARSATCRGRRSRRSSACPAGTRSSPSSSLAQRGLTGEIRIPTASASLLSGRLDRLPRRRSTCCSTHLLSLVRLSRCSAPRPDRLDALDVAVMAGVVDVGGSKVRFAHPLLALADLRAFAAREAADAAHAAARRRGRATRRSVPDISRSLPASVATRRLARSSRTPAPGVGPRRNDRAAAELTELAVRHTPTGTAALLRA